MIFLSYLTSPLALGCREPHDARIYKFFHVNTFAAAAAASFFLVGQQKQKISWYFDGPIDIIIIKYNNTNNIINIVSSACNAQSTTALLSHPLHILLIDNE